VERAYREHFTFGPEYFLPKPIDQRILVVESAAVAEAAAAQGVARSPLARERYEESLTVRLGTGRDTLRAIMLKARGENLRVVFPEGAHETILRASGILADEGIATPVLLGREDEVRDLERRRGLEGGGATVIDPERSPRLAAYAEEYFRLRGRHGVTRVAALDRVRRADVFAAMMLHMGDADLLIGGAAAHYVDSLRTLLGVLGVIGPRPGVRRVSSVYLALVEKEVYFLADCAVNVDPEAEDLAETALLASDLVRSLGHVPRIAVLSFSNFGSVDHPHARKARRAAEIAGERDPGLVIDGEMQLGAALDEGLRREHFPFCRLDQDANVLLFPDLQSGHLALNVLQRMGGAVTVGPVLLGTRLPAHFTQYGTTVEEIVNLTAVGVVEAAARRREG
jgi:malate dehydrogenase (oxaloacetate-decarboxylating)(NADP+)